MYKILVIAPYIGLKDIFEEVCKEYDKKMDIQVGNLYEGLKIAKRLEKENYDAIISRGATAKLLRRHFTIPVLDVKITGYDILRTFTLVKGHSGKIGMMSYLNTIQGADIIGKLLDMDVSFYQIDEESEIEKNIERAYNEGVKVIIGDVISTNTAAKFGVQGMLITSGKEAVIETIEAAEEMLYYIKKEKRKLAGVEATINKIDAGIIIFNENNECRLFNQKLLSQLKLGLVKEELKIESLIELMPELRDIFELDGHEPHTESKVVYNGHEYIISKLKLTYQDRDNGIALILRENQNYWLNEKNKKEQTAFFHFNSLVMKAESTNRLVESAKKISRSKLPIIIYGEPGVGKNSLAQAIHNESERREGKYIFLNCEAFSEAQLDRELFGYESEMVQQGAFELANGGTLFLDAIGALPYHLQGKLLNVLTTGKVTRLNGVAKIPVNVRIIVANRNQLDKKIDQGTFREDLYYALNVFTLKVPPLRSRMEDLDDLIRLIIASTNVTIGKQISGLRDPVLNELKSLKWPGNISQLKNTIEEMCIMSNGPFIELKEVEHIIKKLKDAEKEEKKNNFDFNNKTLEEIEEQIILWVLEEEEYNQSKAAKRLGINRTTLWRKIKNVEK